MDRIPVFVRDGAAIPVNLNDRLCMGTQNKDGAMSNRLDQYENLAFLLYGMEGRGVFQDEENNDVLLVWDESEETVGGTQACPFLLFRMDGRDRGDTVGSLFGRRILGVRKERP